MCAAVRGFGNGNGPGARVIVAASQWQGKQDVGLGFRWSRGAGRGAEGGWGHQEEPGKSRNKARRVRERNNHRATPNDAKVGGGLWNETMFCCPPDVHTEGKR